MLYPISVPIPNSADDLVGFINAQGKVIVSPIYAGASHFSEGKASVVDISGRSGFIDGFGKIAVPFAFEGLGVFRQGLCAKNGGFIGHDGRWFIEPRFLIVGNFSEGRSFASLDGEKFGFIDLKGDVVIKPEFERSLPFSGGLAGVCRDGRWGYVDHFGTVIIPHVFEGSNVRGFCGGLAGVQIDGRWGFIDSSGEFVVMPSYEDVKSFSEGYAPVRRNAKWGLIDLNGSLSVNCQFDDLGELDGGLAAAKYGSKAGFVSSTGDWVIYPEFDKCYRFFGALAVARKGRSYSYVRRNGDVVWTSEPAANVQRPPLLV